MALFAFAICMPVVPSQGHHIAKLNYGVAPRVPRVRPRVLACLPSDGDTAFSSEQGIPTTAAKKTKTEEIAALLGQSNETMKKSSAEVKDRDIADKRYRYGLAIASTIISTSLFFAEKLNPNAPVNMLRFLESTSAPASVVGTNGKPSLIEFGATWCENCRSMAKGVFELEKQYGDQVNFLVVDGDDPNNAEIIERFGVDGIPQFSMVSRDGSVKANLIGKVPQQVLRKDIDALLREEAMPFPGLSLEDLFPKSS